MNYKEKRRLEKLREHEERVQNKRITKALSGQRKPSDDAIIKNLRRGTHG